MFVCRRLRLAAFLAGLASLLIAQGARALSLSVAPAPAVPTGALQTLHISNVGEAVGSVTFTWNFGDGSDTTAPSTDLTATHTYAAANHYTVIVQATDTATTVTRAFVQTVHNPITAVPPQNSTSIIVDAAHHEVWNVNPDNDSVTCIDAATHTRSRSACWSRTS